MSALEVDAERIEGSNPSLTTSFYFYKNRKGDLMNKEVKQEVIDYWNNKWKKKPLKYAGRTLKKSNIAIEVDVKNFITVNDIILQSIVESNNLRKNTYNETAHACQKFVVQFLTYTSDEIQDSCPEFWQFPFESIASREGDCEDGAILMASLMINAGIPSWRVKVIGGLVQEAPTAPEGGHGYCVYLADREDGSMEWEIHDWCYFEDSNVPTGSKPLAKDGGYNQCYKDVWFSFNNEYAWSNELTVIEDRIKNS